MNKRRSTVTDGGFSLVELMVVVVIIGILAAVAMPAYFNYLSRSRQSAAIGELMAIKASQERFFAENGAYSGNLERLDSYGVTAGTYRAGFYQYWVTANTTSNITAGTIRAIGDLNSDGNFNDGWEVAIEDMAARPQPYDTGGGDEGFTFSFLGSLLNQD